MKINNVVSLSLSLSLEIGNDLSHSPWICFVIRHLSLNLVGQGMVPDLGEAVVNNFPFVSGTFNFPDAAELS